MAPTAIRQLLDATAADALAELELRLSLGLIQFASDLASGRLEPSEVDPELFVYPQDVDHAEVIRAAADANDLEAFVASFPSGAGRVPPPAGGARRVPRPGGKRRRTGARCPRGRHWSRARATPGGGAAGAPLGIERCRGGASGGGRVRRARILRRAAGGGGGPLPAAPRPRAGRQGRPEDARRR